MLYSYTAADRSGKRIEGKEDAETEQELAARLRGKGLLLVEAKASKGSKTGNLDITFIKNFFGRFRRVSLIERINFTKNIAVMISAGMPLTKSLDAMANQTESSKFKAVILDVLTQITKGKSFSQSLSAHKKVFGEIYVNMIASAEISGKLEKTLLVLARQLKKDYDLRSRVRGAMIYPAVVVCVLILIGVLLLVYVMPTLIQVFEDLHAELPLSTQFLVASSNYLINYYIYIIAVVTAMVVSLRKALKTAAGKQMFDKVILKVPIFGPLVKKYNIARFSRTLGSLLSSGVPVTRALEISSGVLGNFFYKKAIMDSFEEIQKGKTINEVLKRYPDLFPIMLTQTIQVGEETGTISRMFLRLAIFYEGEVTNTTKNMSSIIEPLLMVGIGGAVGFFAISVIQPIYSSMGG